MFRSLNLVAGTFHSEGRDMKSAATNSVAKLAVYSPHRAPAHLQYGDGFVVFPQS
jgi:hypothetical protein